MAPESDGNPTLVAMIRERIRLDGPITLAAFMKLALYEPTHGYYRQPDRKPGRGGDFITSPELHPFFGMTLANQVIETWRALGEPARMTVREPGASSGTMAYDIMAGLSQRAPELLDALDYRVVDVNEHRAAESLRAMETAGLRRHVSVESPDGLEPIEGLVLANEVADAVPVHRLVVREGAFQERFVDWRKDGFAWVEDAPSVEIEGSGIIDHLEHDGIDSATLADGAILDVSPDAAEWVKGIAASLRRGLTAVIDYGYDTAELFSAHRLEGTLRGYHAHTVTDDPFVRVGEQDLTAHVDFGWLTDAASRVGMRRVGLVSQGEYLANLGLGDWLIELGRQPDVTPDEYLTAQSAVYRLIDPSGLGRFRVLGLAKGLDEVPWRGFSGPETGSLPRTTREERQVRFGSRTNAPEAHRSEPSQSLDK